MEITATVRLCEGEGEPVVETCCFSTLPSGLEEMVAWLSGHGVEAAVMEGTGVYWQAPFEALEVGGIEAILVHARQVKQLKGRKTDVADSVWLEHDALEARIAAYTKKIDGQMTPWEERLRLLTTIPGIDRIAASTILIEIGPDIGVFASKEHFAAWAGLCPGNNESGGKRRNARTRMGSKTLRACLVECAHGAARTKGCQFEAHHRALAARRGYKRAIVAGAHKMLRIIYVVLRTGRPYYDRTADYDALMVKRNAPRWIRMLRRYGYIEPADAELKAA